LERSRDELEKTLARSWVRPLRSEPPNPTMQGGGFGGLGGNGGPGPMTEPEWEAMWELAANRRGRLAHRFVEEASRTPGTSRQLRDRASYALFAAVGLDEERRAETEALLLARLDDPALSAEQKIDLAIAASGWDGLSGPAAGVVARELTHAFTTCWDRINTAPAVADGLSAVANRLEARDAAQLCATLIQIMIDDKTDDLGVSQLTPCVEAVATRVAARDAPALIDLAVDALVRNTRKISDKQPHAQPVYFARCVEAVAARLEAGGAPEITAQAASRAVEAMKKNQSRDGRIEGSFKSAFSAVAAAMEARAAATLLVQAIKDDNDLHATWPLTECLWPVIARMQDKDAAETFAAFVKVLKDKNDPHAWASVEWDLSKTPMPLGAKDAAPVAVLLVQAMKGDGSPNDLRQLALGVSAMTALMDARDAGPVAAQAAGHLLRALEDAQGGAAGVALYQGLAAVAPKVQGADEPAVKRQMADAILEAIPDGKFYQHLDQWFIVLRAIADRLEPRDAARVAASLLASMEDVGYGNAPTSFKSSFSAVVARLEPKYAAELAGSFIQARIHGNVASRYDLEAFAALAVRLDAKDAARAVTSLIQAMKNERQGKYGDHLEQTLTIVAPRLEVDEAEREAMMIIQILKDGKYRYGDELGRSLAALVVRLQAKERARMATTLLQVIKEEDTNFWLLPHLVVCLSHLAARMEPEDAARIAGTVIQIAMTARNPSTTTSLIASLRDLAPFMKTDDAAEAATFLVRQINNGANDNSDQGPVGALAAVSQKMEAAAAALVLVDLLKRRKDPVVLQQLTTALSAVTDRMPPEDADATLTQALKDTREVSARSWLAKSLAEYRLRADSQDAAATTAQAVALLMLAASKNPVLGSSASEGSPYSILDLLTVVAPRELPSLAMTAAAAVAFPCSIGPPFTAFTLLPSAVEPPPCHLSTQQLVDLLKMPISVGMEQRLLLDQLANRYRRNFDTVWDFVRYAKEQKLDLDFTTPPQRPER
jgi:hypothetical protein